MRYRATMHNGKTGKNGAYTPKHNDRNFDEERKNFAELCGNEAVKFSFDECESLEKQESEFYKQHFSKSLENKNEKYESTSNYSKVKTMNEYRRSKRTCPEETIFQIGNEEIGHVRPSQLIQIILEQIEWETKTFPQVEYLNLSLHLDETSPHIHTRKVFIAHDENGNEEVNMTKCFAEMGIENAGTRKNNAKKKYTEMCREHYEEVCRKYGIELESERLPKRKHSLTFIEEEKKRLAELEEEKQKLKKKIIEVNKVADNLKQRIEQAKQIGYKEGYKRCLEDIENAKKKSKKNEYTR